MASKPEKREARTQESVGNRKCPRRQCGSRRVVCNGSYTSKNFGLVQRLNCRICGHDWKVWEKRSEQFQEARFADTETTLLQGFALVTLGLPLNQVEGLVRRKSETIQARLIRFFKNKKTWDGITELLASKFKIRREEIDSLSLLLNKNKSGTANFYALSRREAAAKIRPRSYPDSKKRLPKNKFFEIAHRYHISKDYAEIMWQQDQRSHKPLSQALLKSVAVVQIILKVRIEEVLKCQIAVTPTGQFFRLENDPRVARWTEKLRKLGAKGEEQLLNRLDLLEKIVFNQIRSPNQRAYLFSKLEGAIGLQIGSPWENQMTLDCMAKGLGMDAGLFIECLRSVATHLGKI